MKEEKEITQKTRMREKTDEMLALLCEVEEHLDSEIGTGKQRWAKLL
jgi:hypothetical protein